ncbi:MAG TPA: hypothetical protein ENK67_00300 [Flavobacteriia bacterium]|nr:hypothetical protein [Flavobacteriia bacterium]
MIKKTILFVALAFSMQLIAQNSNISPYSFFGLGEQYPSKSVAEINMGGIGGAQSSAKNIFYSNPASYSKLKLTILDFSGNLKYVKINDGNEKQGSSSFTLAYLTIGFPITKKSGLVFGIQPNSKVGYKLLVDQNPNFLEGESEYFSGYGSTNRVFVGYGYELPLDIKIGVEGAYQFGNIERSILNRIDGVYLGSLYRTSSTIGGYSFKLGAQQQTKINEKIDLKTGLTLQFKNDLKNKGVQQFLSVINTFDPTIIVPKDYLLDENFESSITTPLKTTISIGLEKQNKWFAGIEYETQDAIQFNNDLLQNSNVDYSQMSRISFGGYYIPKANSITNFWERVTYRAGIYNKNTGLKIKDANGKFQEITDFGISFGVTLPSKRKFTNINIGVDFGTRGKAEANLVKENYFNFRVGFSFVDKWFKKRKLN